MLTNWFTFLLYKFLKVGGSGAWTGQGRNPGTIPRDPHGCPRDSACPPHLHTVHFLLLRQGARLAFFGVTFTTSSCGWRSRPRGVHVVPVAQTEAHMESLGVCVQPCWTSLEEVPRWGRVPLEPVLMRQPPGPPATPDGPLQAP